MVAPRNLASEASARSPDALAAALQTHAANRLSYVGSEPMQAIKWMRQLPLFGLARKRGCCEQSTNRYLITGFTSWVFSKSIRYDTTGGNL